MMLAQLHTLDKAFHIVRANDGIPMLRVADASRTRLRPRITPGFRSAGYSHQGTPLA